MRLVCNFNQTQRIRVTGEFFERRVDPNILSALVLTGTTQVRESLGHDSSRRFRLSADFISKERVLWADRLETRFHYTRRDRQEDARQRRLSLGTNRQRFPNFDLQQSIVGGDAILTNRPLVPVAPLTGVLAPAYDHCSGTFGGRISVLGATRHNRVSDPTWIQAPAFAVVDIVGYCNPRVNAHQRATLRLLAARGLGVAAVLEAGRLAALGPPADVLTTAQVARAFGVPARWTQDGAGRPILVCEPDLAAA